MHGTDAKLASLEARVAAVESCYWQLYALLEQLTTRPIPRPRRKPVGPIYVQKTLTQSELNRLGV